VRKVFKYVLPDDDEFHLPLPAGAELLHLDCQNNEVALWALVDPAAPTEARRFRLAGTGHPIETARQLTHIGTVLLMGGKLVFHLFEVM
jgi:hypothetical protein